MPDDFAPSTASSAGDIMRSLDKKYEEDEEVEEDRRSPLMMAAAVSLESAPETAGGNVAAGGVDDEPKLSMVVSTSMSCSSSCVAVTASALSPVDIVGVALDATVGGGDDDADDIGFIAACLSNSMLGFVALTSRERTISSSPSGGGLHSQKDSTRSRSVVATCIAGSASGVWCLRRSVSTAVPFAPVIDSIRAFSSTVRRSGAYTSLALFRFAEFFFPLPPLPCPISPRLVLR